MSDDDLAYLRERLPGFAAYEDESGRTGNDMRVRAFVGKALTDIRERAAEPEIAAIDDLIFRSQFGDNAYLKKIGHVHLDGIDVADLARDDRQLVQAAVALEGADVGTLDETLKSIAAAYDARHLAAARTPRSA